MRRVGLSRGLFAIALASVAILSLSYGDFVPRGQPFPAWIPWREPWIDGSALIFLAASVGLCFRRTALPSLLAICAYQVVWVAICGLPVFSEPLGIGTWYGVCEALTPLAGAWILYAQLRWQSRGSHLPIAGKRAVRAAQIVIGLTWVFYGWSHFVYADYTASMVPTWLPGRLGLAYFTGIGHIAAGIGVIVGMLPGLAATLQAIMLSLFGLLVWVPSFFAHPRPAWAALPQNQWSELVVSLMLATAAWIVAFSLRRARTESI